MYLDKIELINIDQREYYYWWKQGLGSDENIDSNDVVWTWFHELFSCVRTTHVSMFIDPGGTGDFWGLWLWSCSSSTDSCYIQGEYLRFASTGYTLQW
jgi:hypothetical protein